MREMIEREREIKSERDRMRVRQGERVNYFTIDSR